MEVRSKHMSTNRYIYRKCGLAVLAVLVVLGVTLPARAVGSVYRATLQNGAPSLEQMDATE